MVENTVELWGNERQVINNILEELFRNKDQTYTPIHSIITITLDIAKSEPSVTKL